MRWGMMSGSNRTLAGPLYWIHRRRRPSGVLLSGVGFGRPSSVAVAASVSVSARLIVFAGIASIDGATFWWSMSLSFVPAVIKEGSRAAFLAMTPLSTSHSG